MRVQYVHIANGKRDYYYENNNSKIHRYNRLRQGRTFLFGVHNNDNNIRIVFVYLL